MTRNGNWPWSASFPRHLQRTSKDNVERVIQIISQVGGIGTPSPHTEIYRAGFSSVRVLELLLALEDEFQVTIPDKEFMTARTAREIARLIDRLRERQVA